MSNLNVLGETLATCSTSPMTGFFRDGWCLCVLRWKEAFDHNCAPKVDLNATSVVSLEFVDLDDLKSHATL